MDLDKIRILGGPIRFGKNQNIKHFIVVFAWMILKEKSFNLVYYGRRQVSESLELYIFYESPPQ